MKEFDGNKMEKMNSEMAHFIKRIIDEHTPSYTEVFTMLAVANEIMHAEMYKVLLEESVGSNPTSLEKKDSPWSPENNKWDPEDLK